jgi:hypothetical protein
MIIYLPAVIGYLASRSNPVGLEGLSRHSNKFQPAIIIDEPVSGSMKPINSIIVVENNSGAALVWSNQFPRRPPKSDHVRLYEQLRRLKTCS